MSIGSILNAVFLVIIAAGVGLVALTIRKAGRFKLNGFGLFVAIVGVIGMAIVPASFHTVQAGQIAVVKHLGEAKAVRTAGTYFDFWITEQYEYYDAKVQNMSISTQAYSKDAQTMSISMNVQYKINAEKVLDIANQYGTIDLLANRIASIATEKTKATLSS